MVDENAKKEKRPITIIINTKSMNVEKDDITYEEIVALAYGQYEEKPQHSIYRPLFQRREAKG